MKCQHLIQCCGAKAAIQDGKAKVLSELRIHNSPLHESLYGFKVMNKETVKKTLEFRIQNYGFCCQHRVFDDAVADADIVTASASRVIRIQIAPKALMQLGVTIPVFALTERGKEIMLTYLSRFDQKIVVFRARLPYPVEQHGPTLRARNGTKS